MSLILRLVIIGLISAALLAPSPRRITIPMRPALSHEDGIGNTILAPPLPPAWTVFHPWPFEQEPKPLFEELSQSHKAQFDKIRFQQHVLLEQSIQLAQHLPEAHLRHALTSKGQYDCRLGNCQIWIQINQ